MVGLKRTRDHRISATERDAIVADLQALMLKHDCSPYTLARLAEVANREARA